MFNQFPKTRNPLPKEYQDIYNSYYAANRGGEGAGLFNSLALYLEQWMHRAVARGGKNFHNERVLEVGCGTLNHFKFESTFESYDAVEPFTEFYKDNPNRNKIDTFYNYISEINDKKYDRIFSVAVLEHLENLPYEIAMCTKLLSPNGIFQAGIPCEGEAAWYLGWKFTTGLSFNKKYNLDYGVLMNYVHCNKSDEIIDVIKKLFKNVKISRSPYPLPIKHCSFYIYIEASCPNFEVVNKLIDD